MSFSRVGHKSPYSNIEVLIMANRPVFTREAFGDPQLFGFLPIANRPILDHLMSQFKRCGLSNIKLVCLTKDEAAYTEFLLQYADRSGVSVFGVEGVCTTCEIIRKAATENKHVLLFPIDLITTVDLTSIIDFHVASKSRVTVVATESGLEEKETQNAPGAQMAGQSVGFGQRYLVYDENTPAKLVSLLSDEDALRCDLDLSLKQVERDQSLESVASADTEVPDGMAINARHLTGFKSLVLDSWSQLTNMYVISPYGVDWLRKEKQMHSIESEMIPRLCVEATLFKKQHSKKSEVEEEDKDEKDKKHDKRKRSDDKIVSLFRIPKDKLTFRVTDYTTLYVANMRCAQKRLSGFEPAAEYMSTGDGKGYFVEGTQKVSEQFQYAPFCVYGDNFNAQGEKIQVSRSVIGRHCRIGKGVKMFNSVLFDHVTIEEGCEIRDCVIGADSVINSNCKFQQCIVLPRYTSERGVTEKKNIVQPK